MSWSETLSAFFHADGPGAQAIAWAPAAGGAARSAWGYLDAPDLLALDGRVRAGERLLTYAAADLPGLTENEIVTVGTTAYRVREAPYAIDDGAVMLARLSTTPR